MKIILREDVDNLGFKDDVKDVAGGYARNFLIPRGMAVLATDSELKQLAHRQTFKARREKKIEEKLVKMVDNIDGSTIEIDVNASEEGKLYGSVNARHIADALSEKYDVAFSKDRIGLEFAIKQLGEYEIPVKMGGEKKANVTLTVKSSALEEALAKAEVEKKKKTDKEPEEKAEAAAEEASAAEEAAPEEAAAEEAPAEEPEEEAAEEEKPAE